MGNGKSNPFGSGSSGADGNGSGGSFKGISGHRGPDLPQRMGPTNFNPNSVPEGGRVLKLDPKGDREGLLGQNVNGRIGKGPMKLGGKTTQPESNADTGEATAAFAGQVPADVDSETPTTE